MTVNPTVSIILCTRNRADSLRRVLAALGEMNLRSEWETEFLLIDNGSDAETATSLKNVTLSNMQVRYLREARKGKVHALNAGLAEVRGNILLFLDDDTSPAPDWAERIVSSLLNGGCEAVTGYTAIAPNLERSWLTPEHRWWLASSEDVRPHDGSRELIGANMGFHRSVLEQVKAFDPELGPGALGLGEDSLFGWQLVEAGYKIGYATEAHVVHQPDAARLTRGGWLDEAAKHGHSEAYLQYHWEHSDMWWPSLGQLYYSIKLHLRRLFQPPGPIEAEGCQLWEISYVLQREKHKQFRRERGRPRNYLRHGLTKHVTPELGRSRDAARRLTETEEKATTVSRTG